MSGTADAIFSIREPHVGSTHSAFVDHRMWNRLRGDRTRVMPQDFENSKPYGQHGVCRQTRSELATSHGLG